MYMKNLILALATAASALALSVPASAAQPYVEATASTSRAKIEDTLNGERIDYKNDITFGAKAGLDFGYLTVDAGVENFTRDLVLNGNVGLDVPLGRSPVTAYAQAGVLQTQGETGYRLGAGAKVNLTRNAYARLGYQRDDYGQGAGDAGVLGFGLRF